MKIIDLLNKIANGEEVPSKIKYDNIIFELNKIDMTYENSNSDLSEFMVFDYRSLNEEVEIIEEEKKIPENLPFKNDMKLTIMEVYHELEKYNYKINEIIDYLKSKGE